MRISFQVITGISAALVTMMAGDVLAQPGGGGGNRGGRSFNPEAILERFDENDDGKLSKDELPERMQQIMERADSDKDGSLTKAELEKMFANRGGRGGPGHLGLTEN